MELPTVLNLLGSIASIGAIPLSIYLYLRAREEKIANARREIVRILSYQLGEARPVTLFEVESVIQSVLRNRRLKLDAITPSEVVNDLVTETISNPMLVPQRKQVILTELERALLAPAISDIVTKHQLDSHALLALLGEVTSEATLATAEGAAAERVASEHAISRLSPATFTSSAFGWLAALTSLGALAFQFSDITPRIREFLGRLPGQQFFLGLGATVLAILLTAFPEWLHSVATGRRPKTKTRDRRRQ